MAQLRRAIVLPGDGRLFRNKENHEQSGLILLKTIFRRNRIVRTRMTDLSPFPKKSFQEHAALIFENSAYHFHLVVQSLVSE